MRYHKNLTRKQLLKFGWKKLLMMAASEFSRAKNLSGNGGGKEMESCLLRAKELLAVMETDSHVPNASGLKLQPLLRAMVNPFEVDPQKLYLKSMFLASK